MSQSRLPARPEPKIRLRPYQIDLVDRLRQSYRDDYAPCLTLATGGGKTVISGGLAVSSQDKDRKLWFGCHRDFLVSQTSKTFTEMGVGHGILAAGQPTGFAPTMVVSIDTLRSRMERLGVRPDVMVWDECHHTPSKTWRDIWEWLGPDCFHVGLTATPVRLDGRGLAPAAEGEPGFERLILGPSTADLMSWGDLCRYRAFAPSTVDLRGIGMTAGDYNKKQLKKAVVSQVIVGDVVGHYQRLAPGKRMIYFCVSVEYSRQLAAEFTAAGFPAQHLDARDNSWARQEAALKFARGELVVLTNCGLFVEGYDLAAQAGRDVTVEGVGLVRPTASESLAIQQMGRCLRPKPYPAIIIDHAAVIETHGLPDTDRDWTLLGRQKKKAATQVKMCPKCLSILPVSASVCEHCGHSFAKPAAVARVVQLIPGQLAEVNTKIFNERRRSWSVVVGRCKTLEDFRKAAIYLGYKPGWAFYAWKDFTEHGYVRRRGKY